MKSSTLVLTAITFCLLLSGTAFSQVNNLFLGTNSGSSITTGRDNTFIGENSGVANTTGTDNTFLGHHSGTNNTLASDNTFLGASSGYSNTTGRTNVFIGEQAGYENTDGDDNTFIGRAAGRTNTTGFRNTAVGNEAGYDLTTGYRNTYLGDSAGVDNSIGFHNTFVGQGSGAATEYADYNTFIGARAGWDNNRTNSSTNANRNTYLGARCGYTNRTGEDNVGIGAFADYNNNIYGRTTFIGAAAQAQNSDIIVIGYAGRTSGQYGISIGNEADVTAEGGVALGYLAQETGINSVAIGRQANVSFANSVAIGFGATTTADNQIILGNATTASIGGIVNWTATSDGRFKKNVEENVVGLDFVMKLRPVTYNFDLNAMEEFSGKALPADLSAIVGDKEAIRYTGFIAQEVEQAAFDANFPFSGVDAPKGEGDQYGIRYAEFVVPLVKAIQEQQRIIEGQKNEIQAYESALNEINGRMDQLESQLLQVAPLQQVTYSK